MTRNNISEGRKNTYYIGMTLAIIGGILFLSAFISFTPKLGFTGMIFMIIGSGLMNLGKRGLAGSGVILDPKKAREDLEPWNRMTGGMVKDGADEAGVDLSKLFGQTAEEQDEMPFDEKLRRLHQLKEDGIITQEEYTKAKQKILGE